MSSNPDSFVDEVTEAVRHDRMYAALKRYGWIGILVILVIVGGTAWREYSRHRDATRAERFGDALQAALTSGDAAALAAVQPETDDQKALLVLFGAGTAEDAPRLAAVYADASVPLVYRHLAEFRRLLLLDTLPPAERIAGFEQLSAPGAPFRLLAQEQIALIEAAEGQAGAAATRLRALAEDAEASQALRQRAQQVIVALDAAVAENAAAAGADTAGADSEADTGQEPDATPEAGSAD